MKKIISTISVLLLLSIKLLYGQELDRCWPMGEEEWNIPHYQANLVFTSTGIRIDTVFRNIKLGATCASISDSLGNMLFYTNGCVVANAIDTMLNGDSLNPGPCPQSTCSTTGTAVTQGTIILPDPGNGLQYLLFHEKCDFTLNGSPSCLYTSIIDFSQNSLGEVRNKNTVLFAHDLCDGSLTAVKHANGIDWWLLVHEKNNNCFARFLVSATGISGPSFQYIGTYFIEDGHGTSKFSPDGNWYATSTNLGGIDLYHFNRCNGLLSDWTYLDFPDSIWYNPVEFSPNSKVLYSDSPESIFQFDLTAANISTSRQTVAINDGFIVNHSNTYFWVPQLGPDGKIYYSSRSCGLYLHVIEYPDSLGMGCNVMQHSISLSISNNYMVPNFPNYRLGALDSTNCDSLSSVGQNVLDEKNVFMFPNPSGAQLHLGCVRAEEKIKELVFTDNLGRSLLVEKDPLEVIDLTAINNGIYFLIIQTNRGLYHKKLVVER